MRSGQSRNGTAIQGRMDGPENRSGYVLSEQTRSPTDATVRNSPAVAALLRLQSAYQPLHRVRVEGVTFYF